MMVKGFYRLIDFLPGTVMPIFSDGHGVFYRQNIGPDGLISEFEAIDVSDGDRFLLHFSHDHSDVKFEVGDFAIYSIEVKPDDIVTGSFFSISKLIREVIINDDLLRESPFFCYELSEFVKDEEWTNKSILSCSRLLLDFNKEMRDKWANGLSSEKARLIAYSIPDKMEKPEFTNWNFTGTIQTLRSMSVFCNTHLNRTRSSVFTEIMDLLISGEYKINASLFDDFSKEFCSYVLTASDSDIAVIYLNSAKSKMYVDKKYPFFMRELSKSIIRDFKMEFGYKYIYYYRMMNPFISPNSSMTTTIFLLAFLDRYPAFRDFFFQSSFKEYYRSDYVRELTLVSTVNKFRSQADEFRSAVEAAGV